MSRPVGRGNFGPGFPTGPTAPMGMNPPVPQRGGAAGGFPPAPPRPTRVEPKVTYVRALYDFNGEETSELSFKEGTIFILLKKDPSGWWEGDVGTRTGWFPPDFVEVLPTGYTPPANQAEPSGAQSAPLPPPKRSTVTIKADTLAAEFAKMKQQEKETPPPPPLPEPMPEPPAVASKPNPVPLNPFLLAGQNPGGIGMGRGFPVQKVNREPSQPIVKEPVEPPQPVVPPQPVLPPQPILPSQPVSPPLPERKQSISQDTPPEVKPIVATKPGFSPAELPRAPIGGTFPRKLTATNSNPNVLKNTSETAPTPDITPSEPIVKPVRKMSLPSQPDEPPAPAPAPAPVESSSNRKPAPFRSAPPPPDMKFEEKQYAIVLYSFESESDVELSVKERAIVEILSREVQWCEVRLEEQSGWVPSWYLRLLPTNQPPSEGDSPASQPAVEVPPPEPPKPENHLESLSTETKRLEVPGRAKMTGKRLPTRKPRSDKVESDDIFSIPAPVEPPKEEEPAPLPTENVAETKPAQVVQVPLPAKPEPVDEPIPRPNPLGNQPKVFSGANMNELTAAIRKRSESNAGPVVSIDERVANRASRAGTIDQNSDSSAPVNAFAMFQQAGGKKTDSVSSFPTAAGLKPVGAGIKPIAPGGAAATGPVVPKPIGPSAAVTPKPLTPSGPMAPSRPFVKSDRPALPSQSSSGSVEPEKKEPVAARFQPGVRSVGTTEPVKATNPMEEMKARTMFNRAAAPPPPTVPAFDPDVYVAVHNYDAQSGTELTLKAGDTVRVKTRDPSGWWEGDCNGRSGWFPQGFVQQKS